MGAYEYLWQGLGYAWEHCPHWVIFGEPDHCYPLYRTDDATFPPHVESLLWHVVVNNYYKIGHLTVNGDSNFTGPSGSFGGLDCETVRFGGSPSGTLVTTDENIAIVTRRG